jgi:hypothetical protein
MPKIQPKNGHGRKESDFVGLTRWGCSVTMATGWLSGLHTGGMSMRVFVSVLSVVAFLTASIAGSVVAFGWSSLDGNGMVSHCTPVDTTEAIWIHQTASVAKELISEHFVRPWRSQFAVYVFPDRAALDRQWQTDWDAPGFESACWMVASGVANRLDILSPRMWVTEACEHDPADTADTRLLITHELVHVFHGQYNPVPDFTGLDDIGWFLEGLATLVSGQLDSARLARAREAISAGEAPDSLEAVWSGPNRYGFSGSLVQYVAETHGSEILGRLLRATTESQILDALGTTEQSLLAGWKSWMLR